MGQRAASVAAVATDPAVAAGGGVSHQRAIEQREVAQIKDGAAKGWTA